MIMSAKILEVHPKELKFIFELKKQISCSVKLTNRTNHDVAFKVKTTSPKKYCVRPNVGIVAPKSTCEFTVTMQAQKVAPPDLVCKDKFLIQSTVVPHGTTEQDITTSMFGEDNGNYVEEIKLRVVLVSPPESPVLSPLNGVLNQGPIFEELPEKDPNLREIQFDCFAQEFSREWESAPLNDQKLNRVKDMELKPEKDFNDQKWEFFNDHQFNNVKDMELKPEQKISRQESDAPSAAEFAPVKVVASSRESPAPRGAPRAAEFAPVKVVASSRESRPVKVAASSREYPAPRAAEFAPVKVVARSRESPATRDAEFAPVKNAFSCQESAGPGDAEYAQVGDAVPRVKGFSPAKDVISSWESQPTNVRESSPNKEVVNGKASELKKDEDLKPEEDTIHYEQQKPDKQAMLPSAKDVDLGKDKAVEEFKLVSDIEEMKTKLIVLESKLDKAEFTISKLTEERRLSAQERKMLQEEMALLRRRTSMKKVQAGFPLLFVVTVALISTVLGYLSHS